MEGEEEEERLSEVVQCDMCKLERKLGVSQCFMCHMQECDLRSKAGQAVRSDRQYYRITLLRVQNGRFDAMIQDVQTQDPITQNLVDLCPGLRETRGIVTDTDGFLICTMWDNESAFKTASDFVRQAFSRTACYLVAAPKVIAENRVEFAVGAEPLASNAHLVVESFEVKYSTTMRRNSGAVPFNKLFEADIIQELKGFIGLRVLCTKSGIVVISGWSSRQALSQSLDKYHSACAPLRRVFEQGRRYDQEEVGFRLSWSCLPDHDDLARSTMDDHPRELMRPRRRISEFSRRKSGFFFFLFARVSDLFHPTRVSSLLAMSSGMAMLVFATRFTRLRVASKQT